MAHPNIELMRRYSAALQAGQVNERIAEIWVHDWDQYAYDEFFADDA